MRKALVAALQLKLSAHDAVRRSVARWFFIIGVPAAIIALSLLALFILQNRHTQTPVAIVAFKHYTTDDASIDPRQALFLLNDLPTQDSARSLAQSWVLFDLPDGITDHRNAIHLPSGETQALTCWNSQTLDLLGQATKQENDGDVLASARGFTLLLQHAPSSVLCRISFSHGSAFAIEHWPTKDLRRSSQRLNRSLGFLEGGLLTIAGFLLFIALIRRERVYFLLALWLIGNLHLSAYALGWEGLWQGLGVAPQYLGRMRSITIAIYCLLTYGLFVELYRHESVIQRYRRALTVTCAVLLALLLGAFILPLWLLTPMLWIVGGSGAVAISIFLGSLFERVRSNRTRWFYLATASVTAALTLSVLMGTRHSPQSIDTFHSVVALLFSNVFIALAVVCRSRRHLDEEEQLTKATIDGGGEGAERVAQSGSAPEQRNMSAESRPDIDPLTGLLDLAGIQKAITERIARPQNGKLSAVAYVDLQQIKRINNLFGHAVGDKVLRKISRRIRRALPHYAKTGRVGGDRFVIFYPGQSTNSSVASARQVLDSLNGSPISAAGRIFSISAAIGLVDIRPGMTALHAISAASFACNDARKQSYPLVMYDHQSKELTPQIEALRIFDQLEINQNPPGLSLAMQPILALSEPERSLDFEVLLRVRTSCGALLSTKRIIDAAESNHAITAIDKWVVSTTLTWFAENESRLAKTRFININLSGISLNDEDFVEGLYETLSRYSHLATRLCIEVTESIALQNASQSRTFMQKLRKLGVRIALDDFGAGYSSFSYLKELPIDIIKIDGELIKDMLTSTTNTAIVRTIVQLTHNLGAVSIAEWVEDSATIDALKDMGVDYVQGYAVSPAIPPDSILAAVSIFDLMPRPQAAAFPDKT